MAPLADPDLLAQIKETLENREVNGYVKWKKVPLEWLRKNLEASERDVTKAMLDHLKAGQKINQVPETREDYRHSHDDHFDFILNIDGRKVYIETTLVSSRMGPTLTVVSMHDAN